MKNVKLSCPLDSWPKHFSGSVALGIARIISGSEEALWLMLDVESGKLIRTRAMKASDSEIPEEIHQLKPDVLAIAALSTWSLAGADPVQFALSAEKGKLHIDGDFRTFGRSFPGLLRLIASTSIWSEINLITRQLGR